MRVLITGRNGFVGRHLAAALRDAGHRPVGFDLRAPAEQGEEFRRGDVRDAESVRAAVRDLRPEACIHLAAMAHVPACWKDLPGVLSVNVLGTAHVLEAFREEAPGARVIVVSSSEVYGKGLGQAPLDEDAPFAPENPYALSKAAADGLALLVAARYGQPVLVARPANHIGPGQAPDYVAAAFARQLARIARGLAPPVLRVGNLDSERDFSDVRDVVRAYCLLLEKAPPGRAYHIASGRRIPVRLLLDTLRSLAGVSVHVTVDPERFRPASPSPLLSVERIARETGWRPLISIDQTLADLYQQALEDLDRGPAGVP